MGPGLSPDDRRWSVHSWDSLYQEQEPLDACDMEISPRAAFEKKSLRNVEELQSYNLHCLEKQLQKIHASTREIFCRTRLLVFDTRMHIPREEELSRGIEKENLENRYGSEEKA